MGTHCLQKKKLLLLTKSCYSLGAGGPAGVAFEGTDTLKLKQKAENSIYHRGRPSLLRICQVLGQHSWVLLCS